ncbi:hypothetical protein MLD38_033925 [Melastoma candidum]|uniref:Uncharacterized protein n=1 Tax=Melastoma candidum TaxID=119954 RepID=A0ACB9M9M7_9MYRT|nr:hypothetical protein MLD38_033925 [Melastoma candidum]
MEDGYARFAIPAAIAFSMAAVLALVTSPFPRRATFVESLVGKQWHVSVFVVLNVVLLAIVFTSRDHPATLSGCEGRCEITGKKRRMGGRAQARPMESRPGSKDGDGIEKGGFGGELSDEELNERVERFIAAFRQHLVLDGRRR